LGLLDSLFGWDNPTIRWPIVEGALPSVNRRAMQFDPPRFGEPLEALRVFGRPDAFTWHNRAYKSAALQYRSACLELEVEVGRFVAATYHLTQSSAFPLPGRPKAPDGTMLTPDTRRRELIEIFGTPDRNGTDEESMIIVHGETASDFLFDEQGRLERWCIFLND